MTHDWRKISEQSVLPLKSYRLETMETMTKEAKIIFFDTGKAFIMLSCYDMIKAFPVGSTVNRLYFITFSRVISMETWRRVL